MEEKRSATVAAGFFQAESLRVDGKNGCGALWEVEGEFLDCH